MFTLIMILIGLALIAALSIAGIYFIGPEVSQQSAKAHAVTVANGASQIRGAVKMFQAEHSGSMPTSVNQLVTDGYLKSVPPGSWAFGTDTLQSSTGTTTKSICQQINLIYNNATGIYWTGDTSTSKPSQGCFAQVCSKATVVPANGSSTCTAAIHAAGY